MCIRSTEMLHKLFTLAVDNFLLLASIYNSTYIYTDQPTSDLFRDRCSSPALWLLNQHIKIMINAYIYKRYIKKLSTATSHKKSPMNRGLMKIMFLLVYI